MVSSILIILLLSDYGAYSSLVLLAVNITSSLDWLLLRDTEIRPDRSLPAECGLHPSKVLFLQN
jgi:hypothetical protein